MKKRKKKHHPIRNLFIILILMFVIFMILSDETPTHSAVDSPMINSADQMKAKDKAPWTILLYMCGSDLESSYSSCSMNLDEALSAELGNAVNVVVETGGSSYWKMEGIEEDVLAYYHAENGSLVRDKKFENSSMGDAKTLSDFIKWGVQKFPADKYGLVLWDHGGGSLQGLCWDENFDDDNLTLPELSRGLQMGGTKFEMLGMDACLMASLETAGTVDDYAKYMVASQEYEPGSGWNYKAFLDYLGQTPTADGAALGKKICTSYYEKCKEDEVNEMATLSVIDLKGIPALENAFQQMTVDMVNVTQNPDSFRELAQGADTAENYGGNSRSEGYTDMVDLTGLAENASSVLPNTSSQVRSLVDKAVVYEIHGSKRAGAGGLSVVYPLYVDEDVAQLYADISTNASYLQYMSIVGDDWDDDS